MADPAQQLLGLRLQVHHIAAFAQALPVLRPQNRTATRRQNAGAIQGQAVNHLRLHVAKSRFAFALKERADGATQAHLNRLVGVDKRDSQAASELAAHRRLARARQTHQENHGAAQSSGRVGGWRHGIFAAALTERLPYFRPSRIPSKPLAWGTPDPGRSGRGEILFQDDFGGDENQQLFFADAFGTVFKQVPNDRDVAKKRHLIL